MRAVHEEIKLGPDFGDVWHPPGESVVADDSGQFLDGTAQAIMKAIEYLESHIINSNEPFVSQYDKQKAIELRAKLYEVLNNPHLRAQLIAQASALGRQLSSLGGGIGPAVLVMLAGLLAIAAVEIAAQALTIFHNCGMAGLQKAWDMEKLILELNMYGTLSESELIQLEGLVDDIVGCLSGGGGGGAVPYITSVNNQHQSHTGQAAAAWVQHYIDDQFEEQEENEPCPQCEQYPCICF